MVHFAVLQLSSSPLELQSFTAQSQCQGISQVSTPFAEFFRAGLGEVDVQAAHFVHGSECARRHFGAHEAVERVGPQFFALDVG